MVFVQFHQDWDIENFSFKVIDRIITNYTIITIIAGIKGVHNNISTEFDFIKFNYK